MTRSLSYSLLDLLVVVSILSILYRCYLSILLNNTSTVLFLELLLCEMTAGYYYDRRTQYVVHLQFSIVYYRRRHYRIIGVLCILCNYCMERKEKMPLL